MRSLDLSQIITEPTRITETSKSVIDVILVLHRIVNSGVASLSVSDHSDHSLKFNYCALKAGVPKAKPRTME